jgi:amidohydrolase
VNLLESVRHQSVEIASEVVQYRRHLHAYPELSYQEHQTMAFVADLLKSFGIEPQTGIGGTGVMAIIKGRQGESNRVTALRADMDALPIQEANEVPYKSTVPGVMHACGHDVHTASLLGTARILMQHVSGFSGTIKLLFQPGEEKNPGGASYMIRDGALKNPSPASIIGQHVMPLLPVGTIGFREGKYMASSDEIYIRVIGKGGHAAAPELTIDPVVIGSHIILALQQVISRNANPRQPTVLSFGRFIADGITNIIPNEVNLAGTFRALDEQWREQGLQKIKTIAQQVAIAMGGRCEVEISKGYPCLINNPELTQRIKACAQAYVGEKNVVDIDLTLGSEDFAYYSQVIPASFYRLGTRNETKGITSYVHTPTFDIDEEALKIGPGLMAWMALQELSV